MSYIVLYYILFIYIYIFYILYNTFNCRIMIVLGLKKHLNKLQEA